jgi:S1-C subfamily serine protease
VGGALAVAALVGVGASVGGIGTTTITGTAVAASAAGTDVAAGLPLGGGTSSGSTGSGSTGSGSTGSAGRPGTVPFGSDPTGQYPNSQGSTGQKDSSGSVPAGASADQQIGVVTIDTVLAYQGAEAAGTGVVLSADGEILTNNHVIEGSTSITVTIVTTGASYSATVVGADVDDDIAVLQLDGASDLTTANFDDDQNLAVGDAVTGVGNAGGLGGIPSAAAGTVTALNQTITTQSELGAAGETLSGLIQTDADIQSGDSGGPLFDAENEVVGIDTAAQQGGYTTAGFAIPIESALSIAQQIQNGQSSSTIVIGYPAFLGVQVSSTTPGYRSSRVSVAGAPISGVIEGTPAAGAGLRSGDTITAIDGVTIASGADLSTVLAGHAPGENITITWTGSSGGSHSATVTLAAGPAV